MGWTSQYTYPMTLHCNPTFPPIYPPTVNPGLTCRHWDCPNPSPVGWYSVVDTPHGGGGSPSGCWQLAVDWDPTRPRVIVQSQLTPVTDWPQLLCSDPTPHFLPYCHCCLLLSWCHCWTLFITPSDQANWVIIVYLLKWMNIDSGRDITELGTLLLLLDSLPITPLLLGNLWYWQVTLPPPLTVNWCWLLLLFGIPHCCIPTRPPLPSVLTPFPTRTLVWPGDCCYPHRWRLPIVVVIAVPVWTWRYYITITYSLVLIAVDRCDGSYLYLPADRYCWQFPPLVGCYCEQCCWSLTIPHGALLLLTIVVIDLIVLFTDLLQFGYCYSRLLSWFLPFPWTPHTPLPCITSCWWPHLTGGWTQALLLLRTSCWAVVLLVASWLLTDVFVALVVIVILLCSYYYLPHYLIVEPHPPTPPSSVTPVIPHHWLLVLLVDLNFITLPYAMNIPNPVGMDIWFIDLPYSDGPLVGWPSVWAGDITVVFPWPDGYFYLDVIRTPVIQTLYCYCCWTPVIWLLLVPICWPLLPVIYWLRVRQQLCRWFRRWLTGALDYLVITLVMTWLLFHLLLLVPITLYMTLKLDWQLPHSCWKPWQTRTVAPYTHCWYTCPVEPDGDGTRTRIPTIPNLLPYSLLWLNFNLTTPIPIDPVERYSWTDVVDSCYCSDWLLPDSYYFEHYCYSSHWFVYCWLPEIVIGIDLIPNLPLLIMWWPVTVDPSLY